MWHSVLLDYCSLLYPTQCKSKILHYCSTHVGTASSGVLAGIFHIPQIGRVYKITSQNWGSFIIIYHVNSIYFPFKQARLDWTLGQCTVTKAPLSWTEKSELEKGRPHSTRLGTWCGNFMIKLDSTPSLYKTPKVLFPKNFTLSLHFQTVNIQKIINYFIS